MAMSRAFVAAGMAWSRRVLAGVALAVMVCSSAAQATDAIGRVISVTGAGRILRSGSEIAVARNLAIHRDDRLFTNSNSKMVVRFQDNTELSMGADSEVLLDRFVYDNSQGDLAFAARLARGGASFITGSIAKLQPNRFRVKLPMATIGVRGTHFAVNLDVAGRFATEASGRLARNAAGATIPLSNSSGNAPVATFTLLANPDQSHGAIDIRAMNGQTTVLDEIAEGTSLSPGLVFSEPGLLSEAEIVARHGLALFGEDITAIQDSGDLSSATDESGMTSSTTAPEGSVKLNVTIDVE